MIHISQLCPQRVNDMNEVISLDDEVWCVCKGLDKMGRISYSAKEEPALSKNMETIPGYKNFV